MSAWFDFKLDFEKAYDMVDWGFLQYMSVRLGFGHKWCKWISSSVFYIGEWFFERIFLQAPGAYIKVTLYLQCFLLSWWRHCMLYWRELINCSLLLGLLV